MSTHEPRGPVALFLKIAVRRWPAGIRAEQRQEWVAELAALQSEPRSGLRQLAYVVSLAASSPPKDRGIGRDWRVPAPLRAVGRPLGFALVGLLATLVGSVGAGAADGPGWTGLGSLGLGWTGPVVALAAGVLGLLAGRASRMPMVAKRSRGVWRVALGLGGLVTTAAALGHLAYRLLVMAGRPLDEYEVFRASVASISFVVLLAPVVSVVAWLAATGRRLVAVIAAGSGLAAVLVVVDHADIWPFFRSYVPGDLGVYEYTYGLFDPLMVLAAAVVAYGVGAGLRRPVSQVHIGLQ